MDTFLGGGCQLEIGVTFSRENEALKKTIADLAVDNSILKEANEILKKKQPTPAWFRSPKK
jgi:hypothetical protein